MRSWPLYKFLVPTCWTCALLRGVNHTLKKLLELVGATLSSYWPMAICLHPGLRDSALRLVLLFLFSMREPCLFSDWKRVLFSDGMQRKPLDNAEGIQVGLHGDQQGGCISHQ